MADTVEEISGLSRLIQEHNITLIQQDETRTTYDLIKSILEKKAPSTAFYVIDLGEVIRKYKLWMELFPNIEPRYAIKCNPNTVICKLLALLDVGFDVASKGEINMVKDLCDLEKIIYANPYKECNSVQYARSIDIDMSVFDSEYELLKLKLYHPKCKLLMRIKVDDSKSLCKFSEKFGVDREDYDKMISYAKTLNLDLAGICFHVGSSCKDPKQYYNAIKLAKEAFDIGKKNGYNMNVLDIGGGFPGTLDDDSLTLLKGVSVEVSKAIEEYFYDIENLQLLAEPGRFFVQSSHTLLVNIIGKKIKKDKDTGEDVFYYYLNDGVYGSFNCIHFDHQHPEILPYNEANEKKYRSIIFGPTCDSMDKICNSTLLPEMEIGEWCYVENFGAYTVASSSDFNGFTKLETFYIMT